MTGQKTHEAINFSIIVGSFFAVFFLIMKLFPVRFDMPVIKWFRGLTKSDKKIIFEAFSASRSAMLAGFSEQETLALFQNDFFQSYSQAIAVLGTPKKVNLQNPAGYLAYLALFAAGQGAPGQRHAALKALFRYYPDVIDDPSLLARVVAFLGGPESIIHDYQAEADLRQAMWRVSARAVERIRASGSADFSELSVLIDIHPDLEKLVAPDIPAEGEVQREAGENAVKETVGPDDAI